MWYEFILRVGAKGKVWVAMVCCDSHWEPSSGGERTMKGGHVSQIKKK